MPRGRCSKHSGWAVWSPSSERSSRLEGRICRKHIDVPPCQQEAHSGAFELPYRLQQRYEVSSDGLMTVSREMPASSEAKEPLCQEEGRRGHNGQR